MIGKVFAKTRDMTPGEQDQCQKHLVQVIIVDGGQGSGRVQKVAQEPTSTGSYYSPFGGVRRQCEGTAF